MNQIFRISSICTPCSNTASNYSKAHREAVYIYLTALILVAGTGALTCLTSTTIFQAHPKRPAGHCQNKGRHRPIIWRDVFHLSFALAAGAGVAEFLKGWEDESREQNIAGSKNLTRHHATRLTSKVKGNESENNLII
jgi:hypothetical protein